MDNIDTIDISIKMLVPYMGNHTILFKNYKKIYKRNKFHQLFFKMKSKKIGGNQSNNFYKKCICIDSLWGNYFN